MRFFQPRPPIDRDEYEWLFACFAWLRKTLNDAHIRPEFVMPDHPLLSAAKTAPELFDAVRCLAGMNEWDCRLEKVETREEEPDLKLIEGNGACGTFSIEDGQAVIRYSSDMLNRPDALVGTFAHELCHYLLMNAGPPPGGPELMEHSTDCAAIYLGFGVSLSNSARHVEHTVDIGGLGWRSWNVGYLSEAARVTATAMFAILNGYDPDYAANALKPHLRKDLRKAIKAITYNHMDLADSLGKFDLRGWNYS